MRDCPSSSRRALDPANRCSSGSLAIDDFSGAEAQPRPQSATSRSMRSRPDARRGAGRAPAWSAMRPARRRCWTRSPAAGRPSRPARRLERRAWPPRHQLREHLPLHLRPDRPHQGLQLAPLSAARQEQTRAAAAAGAAVAALLSTAVSPSRTARRGRRPHDARPLGSRPHAVLELRPGRPHPARALTRDCCSPPCRPARPPIRSPTSSRSCSARCRSRCASTITFDNGTEFARHHDLHRARASQTFFCDPYAPWQKGGIENAIGRMRRFFRARPTSPPLPSNQLDRIVSAYNNTPRKCLDWQHPGRGLLPSCWRVRRA